MLCSQENCERKSRKLWLTVFPSSVSPSGSPTFLCFTAICISFCNNNTNYRENENTQNSDNGMEEKHRAKPDLGTSPTNNTAKKLCQPLGKLIGDPASHLASNFY